jgi:Tfp pilus assembly protein PilX
VKRIRYRGVALIIAMLLLLIVTLLATTGMMMSTGEMAMAGNEQFHRQAADAASAGVEAAIARLAVSSMGRGSSFTLADTTASGDYVASARFTGEESSIPGFSAGKFSALHFEIESTGSAARNADDEQFQGVMLISSKEAVDTFTKRGTGLDGRGPGP